MMIISGNYTHSHHADYTFPISVTSLQLKDEEGNKS